MKKLIRSEVGQGIVEFALTVPLLITILCGILDFGWIYSQKYTIEHAAYEGARYASVYATEASTAEVIAHVHDVLPDTEVSVTATGTNVSVTVSKEVPILTYVASTWFGPTYTAQSTVTAALY